MLADRWHSLAIHLLRRLRREDTKAGLTGPRLSALSVVVFGGPITLGDLAAAEQVKPPTMTRLVRALEEEGLVRREADARDGRIVRLRATSKGESLLAAGRTRRVRKLSEPLAALTAAEQSTLQEAAEILSGVIRRLS
jgi:DNA-binding MarR family transcriptional regulator